MSAAEIADNKWELQATKPPLTEPGSLVQLLLMGAMGLFFGWIALMSVVAIFTDSSDGGLQKKYEEMETASEARQAPTAEPAAQ